MSFDSPLPPFNSSDPDATFLGLSCFDLMLVELVPLTYRTVRTTTSNSPAIAQAPEQASNPAIGSSGDPGSGSTGEGEGGDEDRERDEAYYRLESLGYRVGQGLAERFSRDRPRFTETLDIIKFLCKDLWTLVFRKQVDNLKTNHRGVFVLTDSKFLPFQRMSTEAGGQLIERAQPYLWFPAGIVRGVLASMGLDAHVLPRTSQLPTATFEIKVLTPR